MDLALYNVSFNILVYISKKKLESIQWIKIHKNIFYVMSQVFKSGIKQ
jgi:hypothetical protein